MVRDLHSDAWPIVEPPSLQAVTMILISCAAMDLTRLPTCDRLVMALTQVVDKDVGVLKTMQSLVNVAWSLACLDRIDTPLLDKVLPFIQTLQLTAICLLCGTEDCAHPLMHPEPCIHNLSAI